MEIYFLNYWGIPNKKPKKPFLLISSNMGNSNGIQNFSEVIRMHRDLGYFERNVLLFNELFEQRAEDALKIQILLRL